MKIRSVPSPNFSKRPCGIDCIVIHHTGYLGQRFGAAVNWFSKKESKVSAHYVIERNGVITRCVPEAKKAWHSGRSILHGESGVNDFSIGIELVGDGSRKKFTKKQLKSLRKLIINIRNRIEIPRNRIVGHCHISPKRKPLDPGGCFDWFQFLEDI
jgi:N-acetylmuramoyl-L-alanine amidase